MIVYFEAPGHKRQENVQTYFTEILLKKFGQYSFIQSISVHLKEENKEIKVSLTLNAEKEKSLFASDVHSNENIAFSEAIRKINTQVEKYKEVHYHS